jgi:CBS domain-containing protein
MAALMQNRRLGEIQVSSAMSWRVHACHPDESVEAAERTMREKQVRRLPIVDDDGCIVGLMSIADIANASKRNGDASDALASEEVSETLAKVSEPRKPSAAA